MESAEPKTQVNAPQSKELTHSPISQGQGPNVVTQQTMHHEKNLVLTFILAGLLIVSTLINALDYVRNSAAVEKAADVSAKASAASDAVTRDHQTQDYLTRYNLDWFRAHEFAELEVKVGVLEQTCKRK